ncbi:MAG: DUF4252 domain-containing protein [Bacteroides sp.]|nr:DUF4252 domain-containing protein [Bacteroides sp.]MCM1412795.1 DUF4252 domain-containing protein [Bacteroides sp.]MCM1470911.1 DUF4252 domain-containing protein [Bacteroides sp.]
MKLIKSLIAVMALCLSATAQGQDMLFQSLANQSDVSSVYISKAMMQMAGSTSENDFLNRLNFIQIISSEKKKGVDAIDIEMKKFLSENPDLQILMNTKDGNDSVIIYGVPIENSDKLSKMILYTKSASEIAVIILDGEISPSDISNVQNLDF